MGRRPVIRNVRGVDHHTAHAASNWFFPSHVINGALEISAAIRSVTRMVRCAQFTSIVPSRARSHHRCARLAARLESRARSAPGLARLELLNTLPPSIARYEQNGTVAGGDWLRRLPPLHLIEPAIAGS